MLCKTYSNIPNESKIITYCQGGYRHLLCTESLVSGILIMYTLSQAPLAGIISMDHLCEILLSARDVAARKIEEGIVGETFF